MARETKVGLLAGLAFIICFAIILSNRGQPPPARFADLGAGHQSPAAFTPPGRSEPHRRRNAGADTSRKTATPAAGTPKTANAAQLPPGSSGAQADRKQARLPHAGAVPPGSGVDVIVSSNARTPTRPGTVEHTSRDANVPGPAQADPPRQRNLLQERLDAAAAGHASNTEAAPRTAAARTDARLSAPSPQTNEQHTAARDQKSAAHGSEAPPAARYVVQPGDSLSRIASNQYGSRAARFINGLVDANRATISNPDVIKAGIELVLPVIDGVRPAAGTAAAPTRARTQPEPANHRDPPPVTKMYRWYQIKKNDRYVSIAREQLGDASRWREIYELNKDKFPNPAIIREGVRIKLPAAEVAARLPGGRP